MKTQLHAAGILMLQIFFCNYISAQSANTSLSNLVSPTAVNVNLLPNQDNKRDLGSAGKSWRNSYLDGSVYFGGARFLAYQTGSGTGNTAVGAAALNANTTGNSNTAVGYNSLFSNTTGAQNIASGYHALFSNTTGTANTANGISALYSNTSGYWNIAVGNNSLFSNTTANGNVAIGYNSLYSNTTGYSNIAIGKDALKNNTSGHNLVAVGDSALFKQSAVQNSYFNSAFGSKTLYSTTTGNYNTATGYQALYANTTGGSNTATGTYSLYYNTTGHDNIANGVYALYENMEGSENTALGAAALYHNTTGGANTANGYQALFSNTGGYVNTAIGESALYSNTTGYYNIATGSDVLYSNTTGNQNTGIGIQAGYNVTTGTHNTFLGAFTDCGAQGILVNSTAVGHGAYVAGSNIVRIGNTGITSIGGYVNWSNISDGRVKKNIKQNVPGLSFINKLNPITYNLDLDVVDKIIQRPTLEDKNASLNDEVRRGNIIQPSEAEIISRKEKEQIIYTGFIAQDVEKAAKELNYDFSGVDAAKNDHDLYGLRYAEFVVPLVKAVQELSQQNDELQKQINELKSMIVSGNQSSAISKQQATSNIKLPRLNDAVGQETSNVFLLQNIPNPFNHTTTINYVLPQQYSSAKIIITDKGGKLLKEVNLPGSGRGSLTVDASSLSSGAYQYSLYVNEKLIDTKQLVLAK